MLTRILILLLPAMLICQACTTHAPSPLSNADQKMSKTGQPEKDTAKSGDTVPAASASRVYKDPVTGEFTAPPPEAKVPSAPVSVREAISTAPVPTMQETAVEGGGTKLDLQGRFRSYTSATKNAEGKITVHCNDKAHDANQHEDKATK